MWIYQVAAASAPQKTIETPTKSTLSLDPASHSGAHTSVPSVAAKAPPCPQHPVAQGGKKKVHLGILPQKPSDRPAAKSSFCLWIPQPRLPHCSRLQRKSQKPKMKARYHRQYPNYPANRSKAPLQPMTMLLLMLAQTQKTRSSITMISSSGRSV
ncbi:hypothetical protein BS78_06G058700 [Paspalum vaginatum]|nr:hypothetical protein BS78_06G058700 [Paspalum vaginatum]